MAPKSRKRPGSVPQVSKREQATEREKLLHSLKTHKQVHEVAPGKAGVAQLPPGVTHTVETKPDGTKGIVRKRFSAI
jgi:hypothetical protein